MGIENFPTALQPIIQQGFLERRFSEGLRSRLGFRVIADREPFPNKIGETLTKTRKGLKTPVVTPINPSANNNLDNGLTPSGWGVEQYTLGIDMYGDTIDLNMVTEGVGIVNLFANNAMTNGIQAIQSLDRLARNVLFYGNGRDVGGYMGGNTRVITALAANGTTVKVDDVRGFFNLVSGGLVAPVGPGAMMPVVVNQALHNLVGVIVDVVNVSTAPGGQSGSLVFAENVAAADGALAAPVVAANAPLVLRPNGRTTTAALVAPQGTYGSATYIPGDTLTMNVILSAVASMRQNNVPDIGGRYNCYIDDAQLLGLFRDQDFKLLYRGDYGSDAYVQGTIIELLGVRFIPTTEAPQQASLGAGSIHRALMLGQGSLIEGDFENIGNMDINDPSAMMDMIDGIAMVTRPPLDRLAQIIAQSWYWIGGFCLPTDVTATTDIIPTASKSYLKRGVVIESL